ncbi:MAG: hypothetical protein K9G62_03930 [Alphaproteobacteria bacterium]|nr:hypothetical protein [Alphaproteobacteria bacterium]
MAATLRDFLANRYKSQRPEFLTYAALFAVAFLFGAWSVWYHRGNASFMWDLVMLSLAYALPAIFIIHIIWKADDRHISRTLSFLFGLMVTVIFCIIIQWFFFAIGRNVMGERDFRNATYLCEQSRDWVVANQDTLVFEETFVNPVLPNGRTVHLGNIPLPRIVHWNKRIFRDDGTSETKSLLFCKFTDPRKNEGASAYTPMYDYETKKWSYEKIENF